MALITDTVEENLLRRIRRQGRGWCFSPKDFANLATRSAIDVALHRLQKRGVIRRVIRGIYDYPRRSELLDTTLTPDVHLVAEALARKFGWCIEPSGAVAQNLLGLSTQVPATYVYLSDGPDRSYDVRGTSLNFKHRALKDMGFKNHESALIVHALKALGPDRIGPTTIDRIRRQLDPETRAKILAETTTTTGWVYAAIREICREEDGGQDRQPA